MTMNVCTEDFELYGSLYLVVNQLTDPFDPYCNGIGSRKGL